MQGSGADRKPVYDNGKALKNATSQDQIEMLLLAPL